MRDLHQVVHGGHVRHRHHVRQLREALGRTGLLGAEMPGVPFEKQGGLQQAFSIDVNKNLSASDK